MTLKRSVPYGTGWHKEAVGAPAPPPAPDQSSVPTQELDLAAIAQLVAAELEKDAPKRKEPAPPKAAAARPAARGGQHRPPGLGWSTTTLLIVVVLVIGVIALAGIYAQLHGGL